MQVSKTVTLTKEEITEIIATYLRATHKLELESISYGYDKNGLLNSAEGTVTDINNKETR